jgi:hypothetical protein
LDGEQLTVWERVTAWCRKWTGTRTPQDDLDIAQAAFQAAIKVGF